MNFNNENTAESFFWRAIEMSNEAGNSDWSEYDIDEHLSNLTEFLAGYEKDKLIQFEKCLQQNLHRLYLREIADLYIILFNDFEERGDRILFDEEYVSTDGFIYFRCWLLLKGKSFFDEITTDINAFINGKYSFNIGDAEAEGLLYIADDAYSINHPNDDDSEIRDAVAELFPEIVHYDDSEETFGGRPKADINLQETYPELVRIIMQLRKNPS